MTAKAKFRLEGEDATAAAFKQALARAKNTSDKMSGLFKAAFAGFSLAAITQIGARAIEMGDELNRAAIKAGVGGRAISELAFAARMADVDLSSLSTSLKFMQNAISDATTGSKSAQLALTALGVKLSSLKALAPDKQFELLADRINSLKDAADRTRAATDLFGRSGENLLPLFEQGAEGIRKAREEAVKFNQSFSDEQIERLAKADDAIKGMKLSFEGLATTLTARVAPGLAAAFDLMNPAKVGRERIEAEITLLEQWLRNAEGRVADYAENLLRNRLERLKRELARFGVIERPSPASPDGSPVGGAAPSAPVGFAAADAEIEAQEKLKKIREEFATDHVKLEADTYKQINDAFKDASEERGEFLGGWSQVYKQRMDEMSAYTRDTFDEWSVFADEAARNMQSAFADFLFDPFEDGMKGMLKSFVDIIRRMVAEIAAAKILGPTSQGGLGLGDLLTGGIGAILGGGKGGGGGSNSIVQGEWDWFEKIFGNWPMGGAGGGTFSGPRADGGPVAGGRSYLVGERGPELFMPRASGMILPNHALGGAQVTITNNIDARGATPDALKLLPEVLRRNNEHLEAKIIESLRKRKYVF